MKKITKICFLCLAVLTLTYSSSFAQKFGHMNSMNLLEILPERISADKELEKYQKTLTDAYQPKVVAFQEKYKKVLEDAQKGLLSDADKQKKGEQLQQEEAALVNEEKEMVSKIQKKREVLLKPLLDKITDAINAVGKENGYTYIFDTSTMNLMLFAKDSDDVLPLVKAKLGL